MHYLLANSIVALQKFQCTTL